jgi:hypothetical protein
MSPIERVRLPTTSGGGTGATPKAIATALSTAVNASTAAWNSIQDVTATASGLTISLPTIIAANLTPGSAVITLRNAGTNAFTLALPGGTLTTAVGAIVRPDEVWTIEATTLTTATVTSRNASIPNEQVDTTGGSTISVGIGVRRLIVNPATVIASLTITLDAIADSKKGLLNIHFGGTITVNQPVVTTLAIAAPSGQTLQQNLTPVNAFSGDVLTYEYSPTSTQWRRVN